MAFTVNAWKGGGGGSALYGSMYIDGLPTTVDTACTASTPTTLTGFTSGGSLSSFTFATNELTFTGADTTLFLAIFNVGFDGPNNSDVDFRLALNGTPQTSEFQCQRSLGTGAQTATAGFNGIISLATNDVIDIEVECDSTGDVEIKFAQLSLYGF